MRHYKEWTETKEVKCKELIKVTCDSCGAEKKNEGIYDFREFDLSFAKGSEYPGSGYKEGWKVEDLCDDCVEWLKSFLIENGVKLSRVVIDW